MNIKNVLAMGIVVIVASAVALDYCEVTDVKARQRYPWNGLVDIDFALDSKATEPYLMNVTVFDNVGKTNLPAKAVYTEGISFEANPCMVRKDTSRIIWNADADLPDGFKCTNVLVSCQDVRTMGISNLYMIVDLSGGTNAVNFPVTYTNCPPTGGWTEEDMTTKLVLRRIEPGTFMMGSPLGENNRVDNEDLHNVTLTKPYYMAIFELTYAQFSKIYGGVNDSIAPTTNDWYTLRGVDVSLNETQEIRRETYQTYIDCYANGVTNDYSWPYTTNVDPVSLIGKLRTKTGLEFDLPTEAQWECACRAGSKTALYCGDKEGNGVENLLYGEPKLDATGTHYIYVGNYMPNAYGLYDIVGNDVGEWCLDVYVPNLGNLSVVDPVGGEGMVSKLITARLYQSYSYSADGFLRVVRGGGYRSAERKSVMVLNVDGSYFKDPGNGGSSVDQNTKGVFKYLNPMAKVRLAVTIDE